MANDSNSAPNAYVITSKELRKLLSEKEVGTASSFTLLDVREPEEFEETRIEGCKLIPLGELMMRATNELDAQSDIVVYCAHGVRSMHAVMSLKRLGFDKVRSLEGGIVDFYEERA